VSYIIFLKERRTPARIGRLNGRAAKVCALGVNQPPDAGDGALVVKPFENFECEVVCAQYRLGEFARSGPGRVRFAGEGARRLSHFRERVEHLVA
jgi:hypothetical protein